MLLKYEKIKAAVSKLLGKHVPTAPELANLQASERDAWAAYHASLAPDVVMALLKDFYTLRETVASLEAKYAHSVRVNPGEPEEPLLIYGSLAACADVVAMGRALQALKMQNHALVAAKEGSLMPLPPLLTLALADYQKALDASDGCLDKNCFVRANPDEFHPGPCSCSLQVSAENAKLLKMGRKLADAVSTCVPKNAT